MNIWLDAKARQNALDFAVGSLILFRLGLIGLSAIQRCIVILCPVVNDQATLCKEEAIRLDFPGCSNNFSHFFWRELWHIITELPLVCAVWNDEPEAEGIVLDYSASEVMPLNHLEVLNRLRADSEAHCQANSLQLKEVGPKVVLYQALGRVISIAQVCLTFDFLNWNIN